MKLKRGWKLRILFGDWFVADRHGPFKCHKIKERAIEFARLGRRPDGSVVIPGISAEKT